MSVDVTEPSSDDALSLQELGLYHQIMAYRASLGLAAVPLSKALTTTGARHVIDTRENIWAADLVLPPGANLHSWSDSFYYADHRDPEVMWDAPARVGVDYASAGYEISAAGFETTEAALDGWIASPSHNAVLANLGVWSDVTFLAIGLGVDTSPGAGIYLGRIFHVWFGETFDASPPEIRGSEGDDTVSATVFNDVIFGLDGNDRIVARSGDDTVRGGNGADALYGNPGEDALYGGNDDDFLSGSLGDDRISGGGGNDFLLGGSDGDYLTGGSGADTLVGGTGRDILVGGLDVDTFVFNALEDSTPDAARDVLKAFEPGVDKIDLSPIDADLASGVDDAFVFIGANAFSQKVGQLRQFEGLIQADVDGDGAADLEIAVRVASILVDVDLDGDGVPDTEVPTAVTPVLTAGDFIL